MLDISYKHLKVWQKSKDLCLFVYKITKDFPKEEIYAITSQIRRCAISIPSNIAEGYAKTSIKDNIKFCEIAYGSYYELNTQIEIAYDLGYIKYENTFNDFNKLSEEIGKMLYGYIKSLKQKMYDESI